MTANDLDRAFPAHLATIRARTDDALAACGFDALAIFSGRPPNHFLDDSGWPFKVSPHFKLWAPLTDAPESFVCHVPGRRPVLCFYQPADYWHRPPQLPEEDWLAEFEVHTIKEPAEARAVLTSVFGRAPRTVFVGEWHPEFAAWGFAACNPPALLAHLHYWRAVKTPYELDCMRRASRAGARGARGGSRGLLRRGLRIRGARRVLRGERAHRGGAALPEHHRVQRRRCRAPQPPP